MYKTFIKPFFFLLNPELVHDLISTTGYYLGQTNITRSITQKIFNTDLIGMEKIVAGIKFSGPVGLSAGFDYDAKVLKILPSVGFGFSTVGTVTNQPYEGNKKPRLVRLPKSQAILVNKGLKSVGVEKILHILDDPYLEDITFGVSVGSSNVPQVDTIDKAIEDYIECFSKLETSPFIKYYELNISCPNACMTESFTNPQNLQKLLNSLKNLHIKKPIFVKMPNDYDLKIIDELVEVCFKNNFKNFILSNLVKDRTNKFIANEDREKVKNLKGNFSGKPTEQNSLMLIKHYRQKYGKTINIIGVGGVFSPQDAQAKIEAGADLIQLITGMVYEGPHLINRINKQLAANSSKK